MPIREYKTGYVLHQLGITPLSAGRAMGYRDVLPPEPVYSLIESSLEALSDINDIRAEYRVFEIIDFDKAEKSITVNEEIFTIKNIIFSQIKSATEVAFFITTAGATLEQLTGEARRRNDLLQEYVYDIIGSEIAEAAASGLEDHLREEAIKEGKNISMRFSPGYCGWELTDQKKFFSFFPANFCGVSLTESCLMRPVKSVSGIIGIGTGSFRKTYRCNICNDQYCIYRSRNQSPESTGKKA